MEEYYKMGEKFHKGIISKDEWDTYCMKLLEELMVIHKDELERLKNC